MIFEIFKINIIKPRQLNMILPELSTQDLFEQAILERPSVLIRKNQEWHLANIQVFSESNNTRGRFYFGKTSPKRTGQFDAISKEFVEQKQLESPHTKCVYNAQLGIVGIAKSAALKLKCNIIAKRLANVLQKTQIFQSYAIQVEIRRIEDPKEFVGRLLSAHKVEKFSATFGRPNPIDVDLHFQKPSAMLLQVTNGQNGRTQLEGDELDREALACIARSTAVSGNIADASIFETADSPKRKIHMSGDSLTVEHPEDDNDLELVLKKVEEKYFEARNARDLDR